MVACSRRSTQHHSPLNHKVRKASQRILPATYGNVDKQATSHATLIWLVAIRSEMKETCATYSILANIYTSHQYAPPKKIDYKSKSQEIDKLIDANESHKRVLSTGRGGLPRTSLSATKYSKMSKIVLAQFNSY